MGKNVVLKKPVNVFEVVFDDGSKGLAVGDGLPFEGYDANDAEALIEAVLEGGIDLWDAIGDAINMDAALTVEESAELVGVSRQTIYNWRHAGALNGAKVGGKWYFDRKEVEQAAARFEAIEIADTKGKSAFFTRDETAELLGVSTRTLTRWDKAGKLKVVKAAGRVVYPKAEIMALKESGAAKPTGNGQRE